MTGRWLCNNILKRNTCKLLFKCYMFSSELKKINK